MLKFRDNMALYSDKHQSCQAFFPTSDLGRHITDFHFCNSFVEVNHFGEADCIDYTGLASDLEDSVMIPEKTKREEELLGKCDFSLADIYVTFIFESSTPTLKVELLEDAEHVAILTLVGEYFEVKTSNFSETDIYRIKFTVERNADLLRTEWGDAYARLHKK